MVDIGAKPVSDRTAIASGTVYMTSDALKRALSRDTRKGDPIVIAELAGIMAAKKTSDLIPLCHLLALTNVEVSISPSNKVTALDVTATVRTVGRTGVEMEALTAVSAACLTLYDMLKSIDKSMVISGISLVQKSGGKSGNYLRDKA
jgi:cyclic pyranopterin monophosphate synthase